MPVQLIARTKEIRDDGSMVEIVIWRLDEPVPPCSHPYKYRLAYVVDGVRAIGYDNERGKGDHRHIVNRELPYRFVSLEQLLVDFRRDVEAES